MNKDEIVAKLKSVIKVYENLPLKPTQESLYMSSLNLIEEQAKVIEAMTSALMECAMRNRYDGDSFEDQGLSTRRDASWAAYYAAMRILYPDDFSLSKALPSES